MFKPEVIFLKKFLFLKKFKSHMHMCQ